MSPKEYKVKKRKNPWISNKILEFINNNNDLLDIAKHSNSEDDWDTARTAHNLVASLVKDAKGEYLTNEIENNHDPNIFWKKTTFNVSR